MVSEKKSSSSKLHWTTKILIVYLIKNSSLFYFLPKKWWSCDCFFFPASEAPKNFWGPQKRFKFWILDLKVCLTKLGIGSGLNEKSVPYLLVLVLTYVLTYCKDCLSSVFWVKYESCKVYNKKLEPPARYLRPILHYNPFVFTSQLRNLHLTQFYCHDVALPIDQSIQAGWDHSIADSSLFPTSMYLLWNF